LPYIGTFELRGYILGKAAGSPELRLMSLFGEWTGDEGTFVGDGKPSDELQPTFSWLNMSFLIVGVALLGVGGYWEKES